MRLHRSIVIASVFGIAVAGCARDPETTARSRVPGEWIAPVSVVGSAPETPAALPSPSASEAVALRKVLAFDATALESATVGSAERETPKKDSWHVEGMISSFAISAKGVFGLFLGSGTTGVKVIWRRDVKATPLPAPSATPSTTPSPAPRPPTIGVVDAGSSLRLTPATTDATLDRELERVARAADASGAVTDSTRLRASLRRHGRSFLATARALAGASLGAGWTARQYRLELGLDGAGKTVPVSLGAAINLRLDWEPVGELAARAPGSETTAHPDPALARFLRSAALQLATLSDAALDLKGTGFELESMRLGVGFTAGGELAVARLQGAATGSVTFEREPGATATPPQNLPDAELPLLGERLSPAGRALVTLPSRVYLPGYRRSLRIASYFAHLADGAASSRWHIEEIETEFDFAAGGELALARVDGTAVVAISFKRKEHP